MDKIFVINKPKNYTSNDVIKKIKYALKLKKIGHGGTLDPLATGVLIIGIDESTKLLNNHLNSVKEYICEIEFGYQTTTFDLEGQITNYSNIVDIKLSDIIEALDKLKKEYFQTPPLFSAIKKNGKPLYEYARKNINVEIEPRKVELLSYKILNYKSNVLTLKIKVSKGFYVRSLANDLASMLNTYGTLIKLTRTASGNYSIRSAYSIDEFIEMYKKNHLI